jgi:hypothetical protein
VAPQASGQRIGARRRGALVQGRLRVLTRCLPVWVLTTTVLGCSALSSPSPTVSPSQSTPPTPSATVIESQPSAAPSSPSSGWAEVAINADAFVNAQVNAVIPWGTGFEAVGTAAGGPVAWTSTDGRAWVRSDPLPAPNAGQVSMTDVLAGGPGLVAVGFELGSNPCAASAPVEFASTEAIPIRAIVWTSTDGHRWTRVPDTHAFDLSDMQHLARIGAMFVAIGSTTRSCTYQYLTWTSPDGLHWASHEVAAFKNGGPFDLVADGGRLVAVGRAGCTTGTNCNGGCAVGGNCSGGCTTGSNAITPPSPPPPFVSCRAAAWTSVDGITWQAGTKAIPGGSGMATVASGSHGLVATGWDTTGGTQAGGTQVWTSADGITWRAAVTAGEMSSIGGSVDAISGGYVMAGANAIWVSTDGSSWLNVAAGQLPTQTDFGPVAAGQTATMVFGVLNDGSVVEWAGPPQVSP